MSSRLRFSILMTSAPKSASIRVATEPTPIQQKSATRSPASGPVRGRGDRSATGGLAAMLAPLRRRNWWSGPTAEPVPRLIAVGAGFGGQPEHAFADDVALHLVGAAGDPVTRGAEHVLAPRVRAPLAGVGHQPWAEHLFGELRDRRHPLCPAQLAH